MDMSAGYESNAIDTVGIDASPTESEPIADTASLGADDAPDAEGHTEPRENEFPIDGTAEEDGSDTTPAVDYEKMMRDDLEELRANFPELSELRDVSELPSALRYAALRDLGLTATEAYLATSQRVKKRDNRAHLSLAVSHTAGTPRGAMSRGELAVARELFSGLSDAQIYNLYKKVTH